MSHYHGFVVRLVDGPTQYEGRVEVYYNGEWGTVCDDGWDLNDAQVVCNELGLDHVVAPAAKYNAFYGESKYPIWLNNLQCVGTELSIKNCSHSGWGINNCSHSQDVGVKCISGKFVRKVMIIQLTLEFSAMLYLQLFNISRLTVVSHKAKKKQTIHDKQVSYLHIALL